MENTERKSGLGKCCFNHWQGWLILFLPIIILIGMLVNDDKAYCVVYVIIVMLICWITGVLPLPITALLPVATFPLMNIMPSDNTCSLYFKQTTVNFLVSVIIACSIEYTNLHAFLSAVICKFVGASPRKLHLFLVITTTLLSMIITNGSCIAIMYPITKGILEQLGSQEVCKIYEDNNPDIPKSARKPSRVAICFYLSIAYACSMGSSGNLTGNQTNLEFRKTYDTRFPDAPDQIDFKHFLLYALPQMLVYTILMFLIMEYTHMGLFRSNSPDAMAVKQTEEDRIAANNLAAAKYETIGTLTTAQCYVLTLYILMIIMLITREPEFIDGWGEISPKKFLNASVTTIFALLTFALPANILFLKCWDERSLQKTSGLLVWKFVNSNVPWDIIFVIGCGGALSEGVKVSGLARKLGELFSNFKDLPTPISLLIAIFLMVLFSNVTVNVGVMSALAPGIIQLAVESKAHPLLFMLPTGLVGSMAFLMPPATVSNALVGTYANIRPKQFFLGGIGPTIAAVITIFIFSQSWGLLVYSDWMEYPDWVKLSTTLPEYGDEDKD